MAPVGKPDVISLILVFHYNYMCPYCTVFKLLPLIYENNNGSPHASSVVRFIVSWPEDAMIDRLTRYEMPKFTHSKNGTGTKLNAAT